MNLEEEYQKLIQSLYDKMREDIELKELTLDVAKRLAAKIVSDTGLEDLDKYYPIEPMWSSSSWCSGG